MTPRLHDVMPSVAAALGVPQYTNTLRIPAADRFIVCLVDGLGWIATQEHPELAPFLHSVAGEPIEADFPTTTPVGLGAFGTGLPTGEHGLVGASFWLPEIDAVLAPLHWPHDVPPLMVQPEPTMFEILARSGIPAVSVGAGAYAESGLTRAVLRGAKYRAAENFADVVRQATRSEAGCTYVYWSALDRVGHAQGIDSAAWRVELANVDTLVRAIVDAAAPGTTVVVTADHGMFDTNAAHRYPIDESTVLRQGVRCIAGEPRLRHVYFREPLTAGALDMWRSELDGIADVRSREEALPLFGDVAVGIEDRIGDLVCIAQDRWVLTSHVDPRVSNFIGQHGARTDAERLIPGIVIPA